MEMPLSRLTAQIQTFMDKSLPEGTGNFRALSKEEISTNRESLLAGESEQSIA
jgi:hypothetical protein